MKNLNLIPAVLLLALLFSTLQACEQENIDPLDPETDFGTGQFKVAMTDSPANYEALEIQIDRIEILNDTYGWVTLQDQSQIVSVLELTNGVQVQLNAEWASAVLSGNYTMLKIKFGEANWLTLGNASNSETEATDMKIREIPLDLQDQQEYLIPINHRINANSQSELLLDFNVAASIQEGNEKFYLTPAITVISDSKTGIRGEVDGVRKALVYVTNDEGTVFLSSYTNAKGQFLFRGLDEGEYNVEILTGLDGREDQAESVNIERVFVADNNITTIGTVDLSK